jgi:hypothetical protein
MGQTMSLLDRWLEKHTMNQWEREALNWEKWNDDVVAQKNDVTMIAGGCEMLRVAEDGFYVRGVRVPADEQEAETVYRAFKEMLTWANINRR